MNKSILSVLFLALLSASAHAEFSYRIYPVGDVGSDTAYATGLNDHGDVVGFTSVGYQDTPYVWHEGIATRIPVNGQAWAINDSGVVAGSADPGAYSWNGKVVTWLPGGLGEATAINASGEMVGRADDSIDHYQATIWKNGILSQPNLHDPYTSFAEAINDEGDVVGESMNGPMYAFLDRNGIITTLRGRDWDWAYGINNKDQVVGVSMQVDHDGSEAVLWQNGTFKRLHSLPGSPNDEALAINGSGWIVGASEGADALDNVPGARATLWINEAPTDLNSLIPADSGWVLYNCTAVNNRGQIIGEGIFKGQARSFIMTPSTVAIPLPSPLLIGAITFPLAIWMNRRWIRRAA